MSEPIKTSIDIEVVRVFDRVQLSFSKEGATAVSIALSVEGASKLAELLSQAASDTEEKLENI